MAMRAGRGGGAVRWAYGVVVTLCAVLAVLVHHEVTAIGAAPMPGMSLAAMQAADHAGHGMPDAVQPSFSGSSTHDLGAGTCAGAGMQHCGAAGVSSVHLVAPDHNDVPPPVNLPPTLSGNAPGTVVSRAPPDLSVLSQLRI
ncbi:hypothetical protein [Streptomyces sp. NPDC005374]|uniref:hypothetical protein n=1 Tax=Streptomyces sp. NPDC005374 TaxID=3364713 RepID=UPI0036BCC08E